MARYFLTRLRVEGFRGINNEGEPLDLRFSQHSVNSIFAVNANGKSSLFDALCYAFHGEIPRLALLQAQENPDAYYCNRFHSGNGATIELELAPDDGTADVSIKIERNRQGQRTVTCPTGHTDPQALLTSLGEDFQPFGLPDLYPLHQRYASSARPRFLFAARPFRLFRHAAVSLGRIKHDGPEW